MGVIAGASLHMQARIALTHGAWPSIPRKTNLPKCCSSCQPGFAVRRPPMLFEKNDSPALPAPAGLNIGGGVHKEAPWRIDCAGGRGGSPDCNPLLCASTIFKSPTCIRRVIARVTVGAIFGEKVGVIVAILTPTITRSGNCCGNNYPNNYPNNYRLGVRIPKRESEKRSGLLGNCYVIKYKLIN